MTRMTRAAAHLPEEEVKRRMKHELRPWCQVRWLIIYNALVDPRKAEDIAKHCGVSKATVHQVISAYNRLGAEAVETPGKGGRRHAYLSREKGKQFLAPFFAQAERGEMATVTQIQHAFEEKIGHSVNDSTIYRLLHRHGWRKLMPRPRHPKVDPQLQAQFKKTFPAQVEAAVATREVGYERPVLVMAQDEGCFGRISRAKRCWAPPGIRPHALAQVVREYIYAYAAVAPALGQMVSLILQRQRRLIGAIPKRVWCSTRETNHTSRLHQRQHPVNGKCPLSFQDVIQCIAFPRLFSNLIFLAWINGNKLHADPWPIKEV